MKINFSCRHLSIALAFWQCNDLFCHDKPTFYVKIIDLQKVAMQLAGWLVNVGLVVVL